ncbi:MAG: hypothetical protein ACUVXB_16620, partial [Bryobacteraceae bacterium]
MQRECTLPLEKREAQFTLLSKLQRESAKGTPLSEAASHVRQCEPCAREYLRKVLAGELWRFRVPIAGETAEGPSQPPAGSLAELEATLLNQAIQAHKANKHG